MSHRFPRRLRLLFVLSLAGALPACVAAAAAGAGAATGAYLTSRGAESQVNMSVDAVAKRVPEAFRSFNIEPIASSAEQRGDKRTYEGKRGDLDVTVNIERQSDSISKVEVTARENLAEWDKDFAREVLAKITAS
jgi:uncharacterized cupredoxin-like copper-binding protein